MASFDTPSLLQAVDDIDKGNHSSAVELLTPLAAACNPKAQCSLASMFQCGLGVETDGKKAIELYLEVARQNIREELLSAIAYHNLATIYTAGLLQIERDDEKAAEFEARAKELGFEM
jgi:TPR repeat protein